MSKQYYIEMPVTMILRVGVNADSKEEALDKVRNANIALEPKFDAKELDFVENEWEMHDEIVRGNVFYGLINRVNIEEEDEKDE